MNIIKKYLKIIKIYFIGSLMKQMEYKFNFLFGGVFELVWLLMYLVFINIIFINTGTIGGWNRYEIMLLTFQGGLTDAVFTFAIVPGLGMLPSLINTGNLDFYLLKPVNNRFILSTHDYDFPQIKNILFNILGIIFCIYKLNLSLSMKRILGYIILSVLGFIIIYCIMLILMSLGFWLLRLDVVMSIGSQLITIGNKPFSIYPNLIQKILIYILPILIAFNFPVLHLMDSLSIFQYILAFFITLLWWGLAEIILRRGIKRYVSASS